MKCRFGGMVLPVAEVRHVFRWDLDKTYLKTEFDTVRDLVRTARLTAEERENVPGSAALLRAIKASHPEPHTHLVYFISGSPNLIRAVLEKKFSLDGFEPDGFTLKPTLSDVFRGRFRAVRAQVAYKLTHLLQGRSEVPIGTPETLFGDDAENDAFIYSLYADAVSGKVSKETVTSVAEEAGAYPDQVDAIRRALDQVVHEPAVNRIIIHLDRRNNQPFDEFAPLVVPVQNHLQTAIVLSLDGTLAPEVVRLVAQELLHRYEFEPKRLLEVASDVLTKRAAAYPPNAYLQFADAVRKLDPARPAPRESSDILLGAVEETSTLLSQIADIAATIESKPVGATHRTRDYHQLWKAEVARAEAHRKLRKEQRAQRKEHRRSKRLEQTTDAYARGLLEEEPTDSIEETEP